jgi:3',5'-cyclic AMP phosphodiesterase CpdA
MKKAIFLLLAVLVTSFGVYSCKDNASQAFSPVDVTNPNPAASDRNPYDTCDDCYEECYDCCLRFQRTGGALAFVYWDAATGKIKTFPMTSVTSQDTVVCAIPGYIGIVGGGSGTLTVCSSGESRTKLAGGVATTYEGELQWDCSIEDY